MANAAEPAPSRHRPARRSEIDLVLDQVRGLEDYTARTRRARELSAQASASIESTREMRMDLERRRDALRREHDALVARSDQQMRESAHTLRAVMSTRAVLAHRNGWFRDKVTTYLFDRGIEVIGSVEDGADASGIVLAEQPDILLLEDLLPSMPGLELVERSRLHAPRALVVVQVQDGSATQAFVEAGASAVFTRRIPPLDVADGVLSCLRNPSAPLVLV